jgi:hypothetical protein
MQFALSSMIVALAVFSGTTSALSGFASSCRDIKLAGSGSGLQISAICNKAGGGDLGTCVLSLNGCLGNNNGSLKCQVK